MTITCPDSNAGRSPSAHGFEGTPGEIGPLACGWRRDAGPAPALRRAPSRTRAASNQPPCRCARCRPNSEYRRRGWKRSIHGPPHAGLLALRLVLWGRKGEGFIVSNKIYFTCRFCVDRFSSWCRVGEGRQRGVCGRVTRSAGGQSRGDEIRGTAPWNGSERLATRPFRRMLYALV